MVFGILRKTVLIESLLTETEQKSGRKLIKKFNNIVYGQDKMDWDKMYSLAAISADTVAVLLKFF